MNTHSAQLQKIPQNKKKQNNENISTEHADRKRRTLAHLTVLIPTSERSQHRNEQFLTGFQITFWVEGWDSAIPEHWAWGMKTEVRRWNTATVTKIRASRFILCTYQHSIFRTDVENKIQTALPFGPKLGGYPRRESSASTRYHNFPALGEDSCEAGLFSPSSRLPAGSARRKLEGSSAAARPYPALPRKASGMSRAAK